MKTQHDIYNATYDNAAYRALTARIDALGKPSPDEKTAACILIQDIALAYSSPLNADRPPVRSPYIVKKTNDLAEFAMMNGLNFDFLTKCERYFNRFRVAAMAEAMTLVWNWVGSAGYEIDYPVWGIFYYQPESYENGPKGRAIPTLQIEDVQTGHLLFGYSFEPIEVDDIYAFTVKPDEVPWDDIKKYLANIALVGLNLFAPTYE